MNWQPEAEEFLINQNYDELVNFYENQVEINAENISHYIYLGLAYLLRGKETEAYTSWFFVFSQENHDYLKELVNVLHMEAQTQEFNNNCEIALLIRHYLREIDNEFINNILRLISLEIRTDNNFNFDKINEYNLINLLNNNIGNIDYNLLWELISQLLLTFEEKALPILKISLSYIHDVDYCIDKLDMIARFFDQKNTNLAIKLTEICLTFKPDNFSLLRNLFWYYLYISCYEESFKIANQIYNQKDNIAIKVYGNNLLLEVLLTKNIDKQLDIVIQRHKSLLKQAINENQCFPHDGVILFSKLLLVLEDNPQENRKLHNQVAYLFQEEVRKLYPPEKWHKKIVTPQNKYQEKIKIGYIAGTFRENPVGWLSRWLFKYHNHNQFEIIIYLVGFVEDKMTQKWFYNYSDAHYNLPSNVDDIAHQISKDSLDILVDVDSLTNTIINQVMSLKLAPIQVTWLGLDATGIPAIDYFIADNYILPHNAQEYYQEKIYRLPNAYIAVDGYEVGIGNLRREDLNISAKSTIYLSIQTGWKKNENNLRLQMKIIREVKDSYFLIQCNPNHEQIQKIALEEGVNPERIKFLPFFPTENYRANLTMVDVVLDSYPFNGATTTLDILWMEIPIVTKVGQQFHARQGYTFLSNLDISEGIAWNDEEYIQWGIKLGENEKLRKEVSWKLRKSKKTSPLWNGKKFTQEMEKAYQKMWENYIKENP